MHFVINGKNILGGIKYFISKLKIIRNNFAYTRMYIVKDKH